MTIALIVIMHDEIKGPQMIGSYFKEKIEINPEFIAQLYLSHAGFKNGSIMEMKYQNYKVHSYYTGDQARILNKEGIIALFSKESDRFDNMEPFLERFVRLAIQKPTESNLQKILEFHLPQYQTLLNHFNQISIEDLASVYIIRRNQKSWSFYLRIEIKHSEVSDDKGNNSIIQMLDNNDEGKMVPGVAFAKLCETKEESFHLILTGKAKSTDNFVEIVQIAAKLLRENLSFAVEILSLLLLPNAIAVQSAGIQESKKNKRPPFLIPLNVQLTRTKNKTYHESFLQVLYGLYANDFVLVPLK
jgi:hypothetical protein